MTTCDRAAPSAVRMAISRRSCQSANQKKIRDVDTGNEEQYSRRGDDDQCGGAHVAENLGDEWATPRKARDHGDAPGRPKYAVSSASAFA